MKKFAGFSFVFPLLLVASLLSAQQDSIPQWHTLAPKLNVEQAAKALDYAHYLGAYYGKSLEKSCQQLDIKSQGRMGRYMHYLLYPERLAPTTVRWILDTIPFGQVEEEFILLDSFALINTGSAPYVIRKIKSNCECSVTRPPAFPVMPGDTAWVHIEFDTRGKIGPAKPGIILYDNSRPNRRSILYLDGYIVPRKDIKIIKN